MLRLGILVGLGAAAWYWRKEIGEMLETQFPGVSETATRTLDAARESSKSFYEQAKPRMGNA